MGAVFWVYVDKPLTVGLLVGVDVEKFLTGSFYISRDVGYTLSLQGCSR